MNLLGNIHQQESIEKQIDELENKRTVPDRGIDNVEKKENGMIQWRVYTSYLRSGVGLYFGLILIIGIFIIREYISIFSDRWLAKWSYDQTNRYDCQNQSNQSAEYFDDDHRYSIYLYSVLLLLIVTFIRVSITEFIFLNAGRVLHNRMFHRFIRAPILFFDTNPIGKIKNQLRRKIRMNLSIIKVECRIDLLKILRY